ncbi:hypothetical protein GO730_18845 [Spirosoma sp. HMF3257]|uniref:Uncharacterized protein n=1 Tax=Spirosoma telluris TaxID=2183553 RepID=A0A327NKG2_9BACT|nr:hypothetical protein [Spirosoma telluris]RAI75687.1 hypothetical protein HMF3257_18775 [Spirosoma telluris]
MKILALFFSFFIGSQALGQGYLFKSENIQVTFPRKPIVDTTMTVEGERIRSMIAKDSLSNYYLTLSEKLVKAPEKNSQDVGSFMDGVIDSMNERYKATIISKRELEVNGQKVGEYYTKGYYGQVPIFIKYWVCLKDAKIIVCQHLYSVTHEARLQANQRRFFESIVL